MPRSRRWSRATLWLALTSDHLDKPAAAGVYWSYLVAAPMAIGLYWWHRRPASRIGPLLVLFGVLTWLVSWQGADTPLIFDVGVLAEAPFFVLTSFTVEDDGRGFDPAVVPKGAGLTNLGDRVAAVGGALRIDSSPGRGTRIAGDIPAAAVS